MGELTVLLIGVVDALFAFFVVAPMLLNTASLFGVQKQFAKAMVEEGVIDEATVKQLHPKKQIAGVLISLVLFAVLIWTCWKSAPMGYLCGGVALVAGFLKYRKIVQYNSLTVKRFRNSYKGQMDTKKFNKFVETFTFGQKRYSAMRCTFCVNYAANGRRQSRLPFSFIITRRALL